METQGWLRGGRVVDQHGSEVEKEAGGWIRHLEAIEDATRRLGKWQC